MKPKKKLISAELNTKSNLEFSEETKKQLAEYVSFLNEMKDKKDYTYFDLIQLGNNSYAEKQFNKAIEFYKKAIELKPDDEKAYLNRGVSFDNISQYDKAIADYNKAIELNPDDEKAYVNRGVTFTNISQYYKAIADYNKAIELKPENEKAYVNRGVTFGRLSQYDKAIADYNKAIELKPDYEMAYLNRGGLFYKISQYDKAIADYNKAIELKPDYQDAYYNRGISFANNSQYDKAIADYNKAIELKPGDVSAYINLAEINIVQNSYQDAINNFILLKERIKTDDDTSQFLFLTIIANLMIGNNIESDYQQFNKLMALDFKTTFSTKEIEVWLEKVSIEDDKKKIINDMIEKMKKTLQ